MEKSGIAIVVDMQKGFLESSDMEELSKKVVSLLNKNIFDAVICTKFVNVQNSIFENLLQWDKLESGEECQIIPEIEKNATIIVEKSIYNCVNADFIQRLCQVNGGIYPKQVFVMGVDTDCCVLTIATSLFENNIRPVVLAEYCGSNGGAEAHKAGIKCLERLIGKKQIYNGKISDHKDLDTLG